MASAAARRSPRTSVRSDASIATSVPVPIARPRSACGQRGGVVHPVADHGDDPALVLQPRAPRRPCPPAAPRRSPRRCRPRAATASAAPRLSPVSSTGRSPSARRSATAAALVGFTVSATTSSGAARAVPADQDDGAAGRLGASVRASSSADSVEAGRRGRTPRRPTTTVGPSTSPCTPRPVELTKPVDRRQSPRSGAAAAMARAIGCSLPASSGAGQPQPSAGSPACDTRPGVIRPVVTVPVLSSTTVSTRRVVSRISRALDEQAQLGTAAGADEQRGRRGQPERAGAGDDQDGDGGGERAGRAVADGEPVRRASPGRGRARSGRTPPAIRSASRCTGALPDWAATRPAARSGPAGCRRRPAWRARRSRPPALTVAPVTASPGPTSTGTGSPVSMLTSTAECRRRRRRRWRPSRRDARRRRRRPQLVDRDALLDAVAQHRDLLGAQLEQRPQRGARAALGARLEVAAGEHEHDDRRGDLEVDARRRRRRACGQLEAHRIRACRRRRRTARTATSRRRPACRGRRGCPSSPRRGAG